MSQLKIMPALELEQRQLVLQLAMQWLGTPYHHQGRVRGAGVDCAMLLCEVYEAAGLIAYTDPAPYPADWHLHRDTERYLGGLLDHAHEVASPCIGDVAVYKFGRCYSHGAIVGYGPSLIHAYLGQGCVMADSRQAPLKGRDVKYYSLWGQ